MDIRCCEGFETPLNQINPLCFRGKLYSRLSRLFLDQTKRVKRCPNFVPKPKLSLRGWDSVGTMHDLTGHGHKLFQTRARNNDGVAATMCFLSDAHKAASFVFPEFNVEMLTFDLEFLCDNYVIHDALEGFHLTIYRLTSRY